MKIYNIKSILAILSFLLTSSMTSFAQGDAKKDKILFVVTSHAEKGNTKEKTGFWLSEVTHPWSVLVKEGYEIDFVSPKGGKAPIDPNSFDLKDPINKQFWNNKAYHYKLEHTLKPSYINASDYVAIHFAGGHGTMWDFPNNKKIANIASTIYENNGFVTAVCHGPSGLLEIKLSDGEYLVKGKKVSAFTNEEEAALGLTNVVPFSLEDQLISRGAKMIKTENWKSQVVTDQRLITGQNPTSAKEVGLHLLHELKKETCGGNLIKPNVPIGHTTHGNGVNKVIVLHNWNDPSETWTPMLPYLDYDKYTYTFMDVRGYGKSQAIDGNYTSDEIANDVFNLANKLNYDTFYLMSHSMTGIAAQKAALLDKNNRIKKIITVAPTSSGGLHLDEKSLHFFNAVVGNYDYTLKALDGFSGHRLSDKWKKTIAKRAMKVINTKAQTAYVRMLTEENFLDKMKNVTTPFLVTSGKYDNPDFILSVQQKSFETFKNVEFLDFDTAHFPMQESPIFFATSIENYFSK